MTEPQPRANIRRFDVFAEYNRVKAMKEKRLKLAKAKGHGLWVAKVVAARKFGAKPKSKEDGKEPKLDRKGWHLLSGQPQTDALFDHEIIERMGPTFYRKVFAPAIRKAYLAGEDYVLIRDRIRADWKAAGAKAAKQ